MKHTKRRRKIADMLDKPEVYGLEIKPLKEGGHDFTFCANQFYQSLELKNCSYHTIRWHRENLHCVLKALQELQLPTEPTNINADDLKKCILYWKRESKLSPTTINHRIRSLKQLFDFLQSEGYVNTNPAKNLEKLKTPKVIIKAFEDEEIKKLLAQPDRSTFVGYRDYTIMLVLLDTGMRLIELHNMKLHDIDMNSNKIHIMGKGAKEREVFFQKITKQYLHRYLMLRGHLEHDYVWISDNGEPMKRRNIQERLTIYGKMAGLNNVRVSPHTFRHTFAKKYILRGGDALSLQRLLGHSTLETVKIYVNLWGSDLQKMHRKYSPVEGLFEDWEL